MPEKILIVDDDVETLRLVGLMLQRQGFEIAAASNGSQALSTAIKENPDLIVLDIMMPDIDGYKVTQKLRKTPETADIPILMFTAKSQVEDKVAGYDAGADDYLTKPVHPAELVAHIKALLSRVRTYPVVETPKEQHGYRVGLFACRGGLGVSTLTLNLAASYAMQYKTQTIAVELRPGQGTWGMELGFNNQDGLSHLLRNKPEEITPSLIEQSLINTTFGVKLILAPFSANDVDFSSLPQGLAAITEAVSKLNGVAFFDLGTHFFPGFEKVCKNMDELVVLTEPQLTTVRRTKVLLNDLNSANLSAGKPIDLVLYNRIRADLQMNSLQISEEMEGMPVSVMVPPAPELAYQAAQRHIPMINIQPDSLVSQQINRLAEIIHEHVQQ